MGKNCKCELFAIFGSQDVCIVSQFEGITM